MAYGYNTAPQGYMQLPSQQLMTQQVQPLFPQPQGNVYNINSTLEVANVPVGAGISVALCLQEGYMYIKTLQNGNPLFWAYKITPYDTSKPAQEEQKEVEPQGDYNSRFEKIEKQLDEIQTKLKMEEF